MIIILSMKKILKKSLHLVVSSVWAMAAAAMAFVMAPSQTPWETILAVSIAGVVAYLWSRYGDFWPLLAVCPLPIGALAVLLAWRLILAAENLCPHLASSDSISKLPVALPIFIRFLAAFFLVVTLFWLMSWLWCGLKGYLAELDYFECIFFGVLAGALVVMLYYVYRMTSGYWASVDVVFSIDSGLVTELMLPDPTYADLRHPLYSFLFWPLNVWFNDMASLTQEPLFAYHLLWGILNTWMLLLIALLLYRLSGRQRHVAFVYVMTMPVWLFCFFIEKYQSASLLALLTVTALARYDYRRANQWGMAATGCMTSSAPLLLIGLFTRSPREFSKRLGVLFCSGLGFLAVSGRLNILLHLSKYWQEVHQFTKIDLTLSERIRCYFNGVYSCLFPLSCWLHEEHLYWRLVGRDLRLMGVLILIIALLGFIFRYRECAYRLFFTWLIFQPLFFIVFAWSPLESPLFSLYFSWAIVPLFCAGLYGLFAPFPRLFTALATLLCFVLLGLNVEQWLYILSLMRKLYPVG